MYVPLESRQSEEFSRRFCLRQAARARRRRQAVSFRGGDKKVSWPTTNL